MPSVAELLEREGQTVDLEPGNFERLIQRRDRKARNRRIATAMLAIVIALASFAVLMRAFRTAERPAQEPTPEPQGIFSDVGGWIAYGNHRGIWAVDPNHAADAPIQLSQETLVCASCEPDPVAWSSDGSKLLISRKRVVRDPQPGGVRFARDLFVLNSDGTETRLTEGHYNWITQGSFSPDGTKVVYSNDGNDLRSAIYVVDATSGTPQLLLSGHWGHSLRRAAFPTFSPDGSQIAFVDGFGGSGTIFMVMNADGSDPRVLMNDETFQGAGHIYNLTWSPDGTRLAWESDNGIYTFGADGSGLTLVIPQGADPYWSPDGSRMSYQRGYNSPLEIAAADGTFIRAFDLGHAGPWNPLVQPEPEVAEVPPASEGLTSASTLLLAVLLLALVAGVVLIRRRKVHRS